MKLPDFDLDTVDELGVDPIGAIDAIEAQAKDAIGLHALGMPAGLAIVTAIASVGVGLWIGGEA